jgi:hypothetical protein
MFIQTQILCPKVSTGSSKPKFVCLLQEIYHLILEPAYS